MSGYATAQKGPVRMDGTLFEMQKSRGAFGTTANSPGGIMKRSGSGGLRRDHSGDVSNYKAMEPISEHKQENFYDQQTQHSNLEESIRDPGKSRELSHIDHLTDFLKDEFYKRVGYYTENEKDLLDFWKNYVSEQHRDQRMAAIRKRKDNPSYNEFSDFDMDYNIGLGLGQNDTIDSYMQKEERNLFRSSKSPKEPRFGPFYPAPNRSHKPPQYRQRSKSAKKLQSLSTHDLRKPSAQTYVGWGKAKDDPNKYLGYKPSNQYKPSIDELYRRFSQLYLYDVALTINQDIYELQKKNKIEQIGYEKACMDDREEKCRRTHERKMKKMLTLYYQYKCNEQLEPYWNDYVKKDRISQQNAHDMKQKSVSQKDKNPTATAESKNVKGNLLSKEVGKEADAKEKARQKEQDKKKRKAEKAAQKRALKDAKKAQLRKTMGDNYESVSSDSDEDTPIESSDDELEASKSRSQLGASQLDQSAKSLSRSREPQRSTSKMATLKKFKYVEPAKPNDGDLMKAKQIPEATRTKVRDAYNGQKAVMFKILWMCREVVWNKEKRYNDNVEQLTNNIQRVSRLYEENHRHYFADNSVSNAGNLIKGFFSDRELGIRFKIYRDYINKSQRRGDVGYQQLFDNIRYEERCLNFIDQDKELLAPPKKKEDPEENALKRPKSSCPYNGRQKARERVLQEEEKRRGPGKWFKQVKYLQTLEEEEKKKVEDLQKRAIQEKQYKDENAQHTLHMKVFGQKYNPNTQTLRFGADENDPKILNRPDYTKPKNKWKVASQLHELRKQFPYDKVIDRMYQAEIADNQAFKAPQEYDIFDKELESQLKENFGKYKPPRDPNMVKEKDFAWKVPNFLNDEANITKFRENDQAHWDAEIDQEQVKFRKQYKLEKWIQKQAFAYHAMVKERNKQKSAGTNYSALEVVEVIDKNGNKVKKMKKIQTQDNFVTLRQTLAMNYQSIIREFKETAYKRFPHSHVLQGQKLKSESFQNSYPASYKNYFFKLVKNIIKQGKSEYKFQTQPASLVNCVGAREPTLADPIGTTTHNTRLKPWKVGAGLKKYRVKARAVFPAGWRTRALKRKDNEKVAERLKDVFMMQSEIENCTFEPNAARNDPENIGSRHPGYNDPEVPGEFFERFGPNFIKAQSTKALFKNGKLKKARIQFLQGEYGLAMSSLQDAFNLVSLFAQYRPKEYKIYTDYQKYLQNQEEQYQQQQQQQQRNAYGGRQQSAYQEQPAQDIFKKGTSPPGYMVSTEWELDQDQINRLVAVFRKYEKNNKMLDLDNLDVYMKDLGMVPKEVVLSEFSANIRKSGQQQLSWTHYSNFMAKQMVEEMTEKDLREAFDLLDRDGSEKLDAQEFRTVMGQINTKFTAEDIEEMVRMADSNNDGEIDFKEFKKVMRGHKKGKNESDKSRILRDMKNELSRFLKHRNIETKYQKLSRHYKEAIRIQQDKLEEIRMRDNERLVNILKEEFENKKLKGMYDGAWALYEELLKREKELDMTKRRQEKNMKQLAMQRQIVKGQVEQDLEGARSGDEDKEVIDYRKLYKTIMCPLRKDCPKVKMLRWPSTSLKARRQFGKDCPYAHHPMELLFPETLDIRISANKNIQKKEAAAKKDVWTFSGPLFDCPGCGGRCNICKYKTLAKEVMDKQTSTLKTKHLKTDKVLERKDEVRKRDKEFAQKFGILKKASVLYFYDRPNDAFNTISKAAQIMKDQHANNQQKELDLQKHWQTKLNLPLVELPDGVSYDKVLPEDITDEFLGRMTEGAGGDKAALKLYLERVCPKVRSQYDKNTFLDGLIEDLYLNCWDKLNVKMKGIEGIHKKVEEYGNIWEQMEAYGSDQDQDQMDFVDNEGNPIKLKKQKKQMCSNVQLRKNYKDEGIETVETKYYVDTKFQRQNVQDPKTGRIKQIVCNNGRDCKYAHNAIELDLNQLPQKIKNLNNVIKVQDRDLKADRPMEPWRPSAASFKVSDLQDYIKPKKKKEGEDDDDKKPKREGILARENPFRKPYEKD